MKNILICSQVLALVFSCSSASSRSQLRADAYDAGAPDLKPVQTLGLAGCQLNRVMINPMISEISVAVFGDGVVQSFDLKNRESMWVNRLNGDSRTHSTTREFDLEAIAFSPDGELTVVSGSNFLAQINSRTGNVMRVFAENSPKSKSIFYTAIATSRDNRFVAAVGTYGVEPKNFDLYSIGKLGEDFKVAKHLYPQILQLWDAESGRLIEETNFEDALIREVGFSPDSLTVFTGSFRKVRFFKLPQLIDVLDMDAEILGGSISDIIMSVAVSKDLRFVALKSLGRIVLVSTESKRVVQHIYGYDEKTLTDFRESLNSTLYIAFSKDDSTIEMTDLDGLYMSISLPDGAVQSAVRSQGFDRATILKNNRRPLIAYDPQRRFVLETIPPPPPRFIIDTMPFPPAPPSKCTGLRMIALPALKP